jgi:hypothetical protein
MIIMLHPLSCYTCEDDELFDIDAFDQIGNIQDFIIDEECNAHEEQFRGHLIQRFDESILNWQRVLDCERAPSSTECQEENKSFRDLSNSVQNYRAIRSQIYQTLAGRWIQGLRPEIRESVENCFLSPEQIQAESALVQFDNHVRVLRVRDGQSPTLCLGQSAMWQEHLVQAEVTLRENPDGLGLTAEDLQFLTEFENSFAGYLLSQDSINNPNHSLEEQDQAILRDIGLGLESIQQHRNEISELRASQLHRLYQFRSIYEDQFVASLPADVREITFPTCRRESHLSCARVTLPGISANMEDLGRCTSQAGDFLTELVPFYNVFDTYQDMIRTRSAYLAEVISEDERDARHTGETLSILFGVPLVPATGAVVSRVGASTLARQAPRLPRQIFAPTTLDDLPEDISPVIRERIISGFERLSLTNPQVIEAGNGALFFHGSSSRSLTAFGTHRSAGGLRPSGELRERGIEPLSGELGRGVTTNGINQNYLSATDLSGFNEAARYTRIAANSSGAERAIQGYSQEQIDRFIQRYMAQNGTPDTPEMRRNIIEGFGLRVIEPADLSRYSDVERAFIDDQFPVLFGLRPQGELTQQRIIAAGAGLPRNISSEAAIRGGVSFDEIRSIFVPAERVDQVRQFLLDNGINNRINVVPYNFD